MSNSELLIYQAADGQVKVDVRLEDETVWLTQAHMAQLFAKSKKTISEHIRNIFNEGELDESLVVWKFRTTTRHGAIKEKMQSKDVRSTIRLKEYDYSQAGAYFVTICAQNRECLFGNVVGEVPVPALK